MSGCEAEMMPGDIFCSSSGAVVELQGVYSAESRKKRFAMKS